MKKEEMLLAVEEFKKGSHWMHLAKLLHEAEQLAKAPHEELSGLGISDADVQDLISAYRLLEVRRPEILEVPEKIKCDFRVMSTTLTLFPKFPEETRQMEQEILIDKAIRGEVTLKELKEMKSVLKKRKEPLHCYFEEKLSSPFDEREMDLLGKKLFQFEEYLKLTIDKFGFEAVRKRYAIKCDALATFLSCIADPGYKEQWDKRTVVHF